MSMWAKEPEMMARVKRRRDALVKALEDRGVDLKKLENFRAAGVGNVVRVKVKGRRDPVFFLTLKGLEALAAHMGIEVPR